MTQQARWPKQRPRLTTGQTILAITLVVLAIALSSAIVLAYININTAASFRSGFVLSNLANVQREIIQLHMVTNRLLRDRSTDFGVIKARRQMLDRQLEIALAEASGDAGLTSSLTELKTWLQRYDYEIHRLQQDASEDQFRLSSYKFDNVLDRLERQIDALYGKKEREFYENIGAALRLQRTSQTVTLSLAGLLLIFGVVLVVSVQRSVSGEFARANERLTAEVRERRRAEEELRQHNEYLAALHATSLALMNRLTAEDLLEEIVVRAGQLLGTEHGFVYLVNAAGDTIERQVGTGVFATSMGLALEKGQDIAGRVWETGEPLIIDNYAQWAGRTPLVGVRPHDLRAAIGMPLTSGQQVIGVIGLAYEQASGRTLGDRQIRLLEGFAQLASIALDNARLFAAADDRRMQIEALYQADEELYEHLEVDEVLSALVNVAVDILKVEKSAILVWDEAHERLYPRAARGFDPNTLRRMSFGRGEGLIGQVAADAKPAIVQDTATDRRADWSITYPEHIRSFIHVPVVIDGEVFAIFNVSYSQPRALDDADVRLVVALAQRAASAIQNARLHEQAQQAAILEERQRLARELHDAVTQTLFSASIIADILPRLWRQDPDQALWRVAELRELTRGALAEMRTLLLELRPAALAETPIGELLHQLGEATVGRARVPVTVDVDADEDLSFDVKVAFYRIAQEALNNIVKHANATEVWVALKANDEHATLQIRDDGVGFDPQRPRPGNLGLDIMRERAASIGATLCIDTRPGEGTTITAAWPQPESAEARSTKLAVHN
ncbi:MAG: GAF domain-containing protein [Anaerolineae bacterium]